jgi:hypothetical protein
VRLLTLFSKSYLFLVFPTNCTPLRVGTSPVSLTTMTRAQHNSWSREHDFFEVGS